jgi:hypothetical protein
MSFRDRPSVSVRQRMRRRHCSRARPCKASRAHPQRRAALGDRLGARARIKRRGLTCLPDAVGEPASVRRGKPRTSCRRKGALSQLRPQCSHSTASQHSHPRSARSVPTLTPPQSPFAQSLTPPQTSSFGQILTQLTGQTKPVGQVLTPPQAEQRYPFAQRVWRRSCMEFTGITQYHGQIAELDVHD